MNVEIVCKNVKNLLYLHMTKALNARCKFKELVIYLWGYSPFRALVSLIRRLHSSLFAALLLHPLIPSSCSASL